MHVFPLGCDKTGTCIRFSAVLDARAEQCGAVSHTGQMHRTSFLESEEGPRGAYVFLCRGRNYARQTLFGLTGSKG